MKISTDEHCDNRHVRDEWDCLIRMLAILTCLGATTVQGGGTDRHASIRDGGSRP